MRLQHLIILLALLFISVPISVSADTQGEAVAEGASSALGNLMKEIGAPVAGGSIPAVEHIINNWDTIRNPCRNTLRLLGAMLQDARDRTGDKFADTIINTFDIPLFTGAQYQQLISQGEYLSERFNRNRVKSIRALRNAMREIRRRCYPPRTSTGTTPPGGGSGTPPGGGGSGTHPPQPPQPPKPPEPEEPPPPPEPEWSVKNPCPECQPIADDIAKTAADMKKLQDSVGKLQQQMIDNQIEQGKIGAEIAELKARIESQKGTFAESTDPESGLTIRAENIGGGKVKITTTDGNGNVVEERTRDSVSAKRMNKKIKKLEDTQKDLKQKEADLKKKIDDVNKQIDAAEKKLKQLQKALDDCVREKCNKGKSQKTMGAIPGGGVPVTPKPPTPGCKPTLTGKPVAIGSKAEIGGGVSKMIRDKAKGLIGGALGGLLGGGGGGISFGGGDELADGGDDGPELFDDPVKNKKTFNVPNSDIKVKVGAKFDTDGKFLVSSEIIEASGKPTFHDIRLHDAGCKYARPSAFYPYGIYTEWSLEMKTIYYRCGDGGCVKTGETDWETIASGKEVEGFGLFTTGQGKDKYSGIWSQFYDSAEGGIDSLGAKFNLEYKNFDRPFVLSLSYTQPDKDPVTAVSLNLATKLEEDGGIELMPLENFYRYQPLKGGGMTRVDPPKNPELLDEKIEEEGSVIDELAPYGSESKVDSVLDELSPDGYGGGTPPGPGLSVGSDSAINLTPTLEYYNPDKDISVSIPYKLNIREIDIEKTSKAFDQWYEGLKNEQPDSILKLSPIMSFGNMVSLYDPVTKQFHTINVDDLTDEQWEILEDEMW